MAQSLKRCWLLMVWVFAAANSFGGSATNSAHRLSQLLADTNGNGIESRAAWLLQRKVVKEQWLKFMGEFPMNRAPLKLKVLETETLPTFARKHIQYQIEDGVFTDAYLLSPGKMKGKRPAIVVFHPTTPLQARGVSGVDASYPQEKQQGVHFVERGYVVLCPRNFIFADGTNVAAFAHSVRQMQERHPNWTGMARMTFDAIRAVDVLETLPDVDRKRIGCIGHSLGGKQALFAAAFDERFKAAVSSEGGVGLKFSNWDAMWYLGSRIREPGFPLENHQLIALIAPRAFLLLAGDSADSQQSFQFIEAATPVYKLFSEKGNLSFLDHHLGHRYPPEARDAAEKFFDKHLKAAK